MKLKWNLCFLIIFPPFFINQARAASLFDDEMREVMVECKLFGNEKEFEKQKMASAIKAIEAAENDPNLVKARKNFQEAIEKAKPKIINEQKLKLGKIIQFRDEIAQSCPYPNGFSNDLKRIICNRLVDNYKILLSKEILTDYLNIYYRILNGERCYPETIWISVPGVDDFYSFKFTPCYIGPKRSSDLENREDSLTEVAKSYKFHKLPEYHDLVQSEKNYSSKLRK